VKIQPQLWAASLIVLFAAAGGVAAAAEEARPPALDASVVAAQARLRGDPQRGALLFYKSAAACAKCHASGPDASPLGPDLTTIAPDATDQTIVESILDPSKTIRKGFETVTVRTVDGQTKSGLVAADTKERLVLRDAANLEQEISIARADIDEIAVSRKSMMPDGLAASLPSERDLYDLVRYVMEAARGGPARVAELRPDARELAVKDDVANLDHAGILRSLGNRDFEAGRSIYQGHCQNCHGADGNTPSLPTARAFGTQPLKYGADPHQMLQTLSRGAGLMTPMQHLSPKERYQVIHYIREAFMKPTNPAYRELDDAYLSSLPAGTSDGEVVVSTAERDYGPVLGSQIGAAVNSALTFRLPGEVTVSYDLHRMRLAGAWTGGFLDLSQTHHYRQRGEQMPKIDGELIAGLSDWQWALDGSFEIPASAKPPRGPLRQDWLQYHGHYLYADRAVLSYGIHGRQILETVHCSQDAGLVLHHTLRVGAGEQPLKLCVARLEGGQGPAGLLAADANKIAGRKGPAGNHIAVVSGAIRTDSGEAKMANRPRHVVDGKDARRLDLGTSGRTVLVRFRTLGDGTLIASAPAGGIWKPNGKTLFVRGGRLVYDIGWVGAMTGKSNVSDGQWHVAALLVTDRDTRLYVDGKLEARREAFRRDPENGHVLKVGATATNFGGDFAGNIDWIGIYEAEFSAAELEQAAKSDQPPEARALESKTLWAWKPAADEARPMAPAALAEPPQTVAAAIVTGDIDETTWEVDEAGRIILSIPPSRQPRVLRVSRSSAVGPKAGPTASPEAGQVLGKVCDSLRAAAQDELVDPLTMTRGGPLRWPQSLEVRGKRGEPINGYALDTIPVPLENPWNAWLRTSAVDFFEDGRAVVTTHGGDVYIVSGIDERLERVVWKRFVAGLFEPFGVRVIEGVIYVTCRDGIKRLHDHNADGEADFVEAFWIDDDVSSSFHAYNFDLQTDSHGSLYFAKAGQYTQHHRPGTIMRVPPAGGSAEVVAWGLRTPNGMGKLADDRFTVSDNQGPWMPAGKISLIKPGSFLGNMPINDEQTAWLKDKHGGRLPETFDEPLIWLPQELDNSCGGQVWVDDPRFGPLAGRLLHSSFGKGWVYYLSLQDVDGQTQASIVSLPHQWDAGVMRLRANPADGQLYGTGLSGWQGPAQGKDGCLQRLRYAGQPVKMIEAVQVVPGGVELRLSFAVDPKTAGDAQSWRGEMWDYRWSRQYGSDQYSVLRPGEKGRDRLSIAGVRLIDERTVRLSIPELRACDQLLLEMNFLDAQGERFIEQVHLTVHGVPAK
jgi:putative heme-binding domain-containing protein